jgi:hypothetical protein
MNRLPRLAQRQWDTRLTVGDFGFTGPDRKDGCHSVISGDSCVEMNALDDCLRVAFRASNSSCRPSDCEYAKFFSLTQT